MTVEPVQYVMPEAMPEAPVVYVVLDVADNPIYVGATHDCRRRINEHRRRSQWWHLVRSVETYPQPDWEIALYVERNLIRRWSPEFNRQSVDRAEHAFQQFYGPMVRDLAEQVMNP